MALKNCLHKPFNLKKLISLVLTGLAAAVFCAQPSVAQPQSDDLAQKILETLLQIPGNKPSSRTVHAKGIVCSGTFTPSTNASELSKAANFKGSSVPIIVRFSDAAPSPTIPDVSPDSAPRGMAIRFKLPDGKETDIVAFSHNGFVVGTGDEFLALQQAIVATDPSKPHPWPVEVFLSSHPRALKFVQDPKPTPVSFANEAFFGNNAFIFVNKSGKKQAVRYQILPVARQKHITDEEAKTKSPDFLFDEIKAHLVKEPMKFRFVAQIPNAGDPTNDSSVVWLEDRKTVELGTFTITAIDSDSAKTEKVLGFDPTKLVDGIELSDDPLPALRAKVYMLARMHRQAH